MVTAYIGLGANLGSPEKQLAAALEALGEIPDTELKAVSKLYKSRPIGPGEQDDFSNAAVALETELLPEVLLDELQSIELKFGRERLIHWGPRTLDLDILLYGDQVIETERLTVPHKELHWRSFVLFPLVDIAPEELMLPTGEMLSQLLKECDATGLDLPGTNWNYLD